MSKDKGATRHTVYLSGPISGDNFHKNVAAFDREEKRLKKLGYDVFNPCVLMKRFGTQRPWAFYMRHAVMALMMCDRVKYLRGWEASKGAMIERDLAEALEIQELKRVRCVWASRSEVTLGPRS